MTALFTETRFKGTPEEVDAQWLEARKKGIGGSDAAAVLGVSKYATPLTVWLDKTGRNTDEFEDNESMYWGRELEDVVAKEFALRHPGMKVKRKNALLTSKEWPWMLASVDRVVIDENGRKGILEIKTCDKALADDWADSVPDYYMPQPTHYLAVTGYDFFAVAVLIGGNRYKEYFFERDADDIAFLVQREIEFWFDYVLADVMPALTCLKADSDALTAMNPDPSDDFVEILDQDIPELEEYEAVSADLAAMKERHRELGNRIKARIGGMRGVRTQSRKATWVRSTDVRLDRARFDADYPGIYQEYIKTKPKDGGLRISEVN